MTSPDGKEGAGIPPCSWKGKQKVNSLVKSVQGALLSVAGACPQEGSAETLPDLGNGWLEAPLAFLACIRGAEKAEKTL